MRTKHTIAEVENHIEHKKITMRKSLRKQIE